MKIVISAEQAGQRIDKILASALNLGRAAVKQLFDDGRITTGRHRAHKGDVFTEGTEVEVNLPEATPQGPPAADPELPLNVLLERADILVVSKPAGMPTAPLDPREKGTLVNALLARYPELATIGVSPLEPGLVHRLDNDTSGVLVITRTKAAYNEMVNALKAGQLDKEYLAICEDQGLGDSGTMDIPLAPHPKDRRRVYACLHPRDVARYKPRPATSDFKVLQRFKGLALVSLKAPKALRHQIRAHLAAVACPIVGDELYGAQPRSDIHRHALHAASVTWKGSSVVPAFSARAELPDDMAALIPRGE